LETAKAFKSKTNNPPAGSVGYASSLASALKTGLQSDAVAEVKVKMRKFTPIAICAEDHEVEFATNALPKRLHPRQDGLLSFL